MSNENKISYRRSAARPVRAGLRVCSTGRDARSLLAAALGQALRLVFASTDHLTAAKSRKLMALVTTLLPSTQNSVSSQLCLMNDPAPNNPVIQIVHVRR